MNKQTGSAEHRFLMIGAIGNLIIGCVGLVTSFVASSQAILLDGLFNLAYCVTGLFTLKIAQLVQQADDERFPFGYAFFEPLINGIKGLLVMGVSVMAVAGALEALFSGGRAIAAGTAIAYGVFASLACWSLALMARRGAKQTHSPLIRADAENWLVNAGISSAVLLAFAGIMVIQRTPLAFLAPYVDPSLVLLIVLISISIPVRVAWQALMELLNRTPGPAIVDQVREIVVAGTAELPVEQFFLRVVQPGRTRLVAVHLVLPSDFQFEGLPTLDAVRAKTLASLRQAHPATFLDIIFTADPKWGAPARADEST